MDGRTAAVLEGIEKHGQAVKRFRSLCDMHQVPFGGAGNLSDLIHSLREDRHFAMDFWAMVGDLSAQERGSLTDAEMLDAIVEGSSSLSLERLIQTAEDLPEKAALLNELEQMLAGVDVGSPVLPDVIVEPADALLSETETKPTQAHEPDVQPRIESRPVVSQVDIPDVSRARHTITETKPTQTHEPDIEPRIESRPVASTVDIHGASMARHTIAETRPTQTHESAAQSHEPDVEPRIESRPVVSRVDISDVSRARHTIAEALLRLEETSRELRDQLDAIEQMKGRETMTQDVARSPTLRPSSHEQEREHREQANEPELPFTPKITKPIDTPPFGPRSKQATEPTVATVKNIAPAATDVAQPVFRPPPVNERQVFTPRPVHSLSRRGLAPAEDEDDDPSIVVPLAAYAESHRRSWFTGAAALVVLLVLAGVVWTAVSHGYAESLIAHYGPAAREKMELFRGELRDLKNKGSASKPKISQKPASPVSPAPQKPSNPAATAASSAPKTTATASAGSTPREPTKLSSPRNASPAVHAASAPAAIRPQSALVDENAIRVPSSTMEANLVASRVPIYPDAAKAMGIEGPVVLEVTISRSGTVDFARAVSGDPHLRAAAEEAVMKWRYKPYSSQGRAVEAATQVRVVFKLPAY